MIAFLIAQNRLGKIVFFSLSFWFCACNVFQEDIPIFNGKNAYQYLVQQCDFGPRVPGTQAHENCLNFLTAELTRFGASVTLQRFQEKLPGYEKEVDLTNIVASFGLQKTDRILLCAHWDSRPWADQDSLAENHSKPVPGANDGASGVAVLLEIARNLQKREPQYGVDIILFDAEDSGIPGSPETYAIGAQHFANTRDPRYRPRYGMLLDMIGDKDLQIYQEEHSLTYAPQIVEMIWKRAQELNLTAFNLVPGYEVTDDHLPLLEVGIPCINLIDFDYEYWHTLADTPDKCSVESLTQVGTLILSLLYDS